MNAPLVLARPAGWARYTPLWLLAAPGGWAAYVLAYNPTDALADPTGPCPWHALFGIDGPSCGLTRMSWYLLHADLVGAARMHLAALVAVPVLVYGYLWWVAGWVFGRQLPMFRVTKRLVVGYLVVFLVYSMLLRNLPWPPMDWFYVPDLPSRP